MTHLFCSPLALAAGNQKIHRCWVCDNMKLVFEMTKLGIRNGNLLWGKLQLLEEKNGSVGLRKIAFNFINKVWLESVTVR